MKKIILYILFIFGFYSLKSQIVEAQVSSKQVQVGTPFEYVIIIKTNANSYTPPNFKDFDVVGGPNQSQSTQYVNGVVSSQLTLSWYLAAKKEGKLIIPSAIVTVGNQKLETEAITIECLKGATSTTNNKTDGNTSKADGADVFIKTTISKAKCIVGEQVTISQKIYSRHQIVGFQKFEPPSYNGFFVQNQEINNQGQVMQENLDGVRYFTYDLLKTVCTANKAGKLNIDITEVDVVVRKQTNAKPKNIWEQFFGGGGYEDVPVKTKSKPVNIEVIDLPNEGKPASYNGAVGNFNFKVEASRTEVKANDAFNLKLIVSGNGNLKLVDIPKPQLPESFESYDPKITENGNTKTFDYLIIPRDEGTYSLNNIEFSYFSLETKKYNTIKANPINIVVLPADANSLNATVYNPVNQVKETQNDIRYIKKGKITLAKENNEFFNSFAHISIILICLIIFITSIVIRKTYIKNNSNLALVKERKAVKLAKKQLISAEKKMTQNNKDEFYTEILFALNNYLNNKLGISAVDNTRDNIQQILITKKVNENSISSLIKILEACEYVKFAPGAVSGNLPEVYQNAINIITSIEEQINKKA
ncbi:MAG: BatD family protein [Bacteroidetes bacterium]|nr:BatD family protein [Bacteroidota bacterium]